MSDTIRLVLLNGGVAVVGAAVVLLVGVRWHRGWLPTLFGLALAVGLATCGLVAILGAMVGIDVGPAATGVLAVAALLVARVVLRGRTPGLGELELPRSGTVARVLELASLVLLAVLSVRILRLGAATGTRRLGRLGDVGAQGARAVRGRRRLGPGLHRPGVRNAA